MKNNVIITQEAQNDFEEIVFYTANQWGEEQRQRYRGLLLDALLKLEDDPKKATNTVNFLPYIAPTELRNIISFIV